MTVVDYDQLLDVDDLPEELGGVINYDIPLLTYEEPPTFDVIAEPVAEDKSENDTAASLTGLVGKPLSEIERLFITETLKSTGGNRVEAAQLLEIGERTLYRKIKEYEL
jgi:two-component system response regulator HydG